MQCPTKSRIDFNSRMGFGTPPTDENRAIPKAEADNLSNKEANWVASPWNSGYSGYIGRLLDWEEKMIQSLHHRLASLAIAVAVMAASSVFGPALAAGGAVKSPTGVAPDRYVYYPGTEELKEDELRLFACGTGLPAARRDQAATCWLVELGNGDKILVRYRYRLDAEYRRFDDSL